MEKKTIGATKKIARMLFCISDQICNFRSTRLNTYHAKKLTSLPQIISYDNVIQ